MNFIGICRSCGCECTEYKNIYQSGMIAEQKTLAEKLSFCTNLEFVTGDEFMPDIMCKICVETLENLYTFKQTVIMVDKKLRSEQLVASQRTLNRKRNALAKGSRSLPKNTFHKIQELNCNDEEGIISEESKATEDPSDSVCIKSEFEQLKTEQRDLHSEILSFNFEDPLECSNNIKFKASETKSNPKLGTSSDSDIAQTQKTTSAPDPSALLYACDICSKSYRRKSSFRCHMITHNAVKPFLCDICGKGIKERSGYKRHMLIHTGEKPYTCDICGREFRYSSNLIIHKRRHNGDRPFDCSKCAKRFYTTGKLKRHMKVHARDGIFKCEDCGKHFRFRTHLTNHKCIHKALKKKRKAIKTDAKPIE